MDDFVNGLQELGKTNKTHAGDGAHQRQILDALMAAAVLADGDAGVGHAELHVEVRIGDGIAHLLVGPARAEHAVPGRDPAGGLCETPE